MFQDPRVTGYVSNRVLSRDVPAIDQSVVDKELKDIDDVAISRAFMAQ